MTRRDKQRTAWLVGTAVLLICGPSLVPWLIQRYYQDYQPWVALGAGVVLFGIGVWSAWKLWVTVPTDHPAAQGTQGQAPTTREGASIRPRGSRARSRRPAQEPGQEASS